MSRAATPPPMPPPMAATFDADGLGEGEEEAPAAEAGAEVWGEETGAVVMTEVRRTMLVRPEAEAVEERMIVVWVVGEEGEVVGCCGVVFGVNAWVVEGAGSLLGEEVVVGAASGEELEGMSSLGV